MMEACGDFMEILELDMSVKVLMHLDDPSDLARVCAVSKSWRRFVIANHLSKKLFFTKFPDISSLAHLIEVKNMIEPVELAHNISTDWEFVRRNHKVYAFLAKGLSLSMMQSCISRGISASSTDNFPDESIQNTLVPSDIHNRRPSYWSSGGRSDPTVPETLFYRLIADFCVITEIHLRPFQAYFQTGNPIYSAKAVRFKMGHHRSLMEVESDDEDEYVASHESAAEKFVWTYISPEFPMVQENSLQKFKLPEPAICIGGILQIELLGRVQRQDIDNRYYICVAHVQAVGLPLSPEFEVEMLDPSGRCILRYSLDANDCL